MGDLIQLFGNTPAADVDSGGSEKVADFIDEYMGDFLFAVQSMDQAADLDAFRECKAEVERLVRGWPKI